VSQPLPTPPPTRTDDERQVVRMTRWLLIVALVVMGFIVLRFVAHVMGPVLAALGIAYLLDPVVERLVARGMSRALATLLILGGFLTVVALVIIGLAPRVGHEIKLFVADLPRLIDNLATWASSTFGVEIPHDWRAYLESAEFKSMLGDASGPLRDVAVAALSGAAGLLAFLAELLLVPVFAFYFLVAWPTMTERGLGLVPPRRRRKVAALLGEIDAVVSGWVRGQAIVTVILSVLYAIAFTVVGMPLGVGIGVVVGLLTVIPFVGTFVGAAIALAITLADGGGLSQLGVVAAIIGVLHLLEAMVLTPKIVGHRVGLSESAALFAVVAGGKVLGFVGVLLAVPLAAAIAVLIRHTVRLYERTEFFGDEADAAIPVTPAMAAVMIEPGPVGAGPAFATPGEVTDADGDGVPDGERR
jgi:predicted PurR-regulated permease PerM